MRLNGKSPSPNCYTFMRAGSELFTGCGQGGACSGSFRRISAEIFKWDADELRAIRTENARPHLINSRNLSVSNGNLATSMETVTSPSSVNVAQPTCVNYSADRAHRAKRTLIQVYVSAVALITLK